MRDLDLLADRVRRRAGVAPDDLVDAAQLAHRLMGPGRVVIVDRLACGARLRHITDGYRIELRDGLEDINFACAHELAHWVFRCVEPYNGPDEERFANYLGVAMLAPRALVRSGVPFYGRRLETIAPLAEAVMISRTAAHLRLGEVLGDERAVVTKTGHVLRSSEESFDEPNDGVVKVARSNVARPGIAKAQLRGGIDDGRIALRAR